MKKVLVVLALVAVALLSTFSCAGLRCAFSAHSTHGHQLAPVTAAETGYAEEKLEGFTVYRKGQGPPVLILHELPGLTPEFVKFSDLVAKSHTVYAPLMFGGFGRHVTNDEARGVMFGAGFSTFSRKPSPIIPKLATLAGEIQKRHSGQKLGIIGMCLTGGLPVGIAASEGVQASALVLSQPSLPFPLWWGAKKSFGVDPDLPEKVKRLPVLLLRMEHDCLCPPERAAAIQAALPNSEVVVVRTDSEKAHAVLTVESQYPGHENPHAVAAVNRAIAFLDEKLR